MMIIFPEKVLLILIIIVSKGVRHMNSVRNKLDDILDQGSFKEL